MLDLFGKLIENISQIYNLLKSNLLNISILLAFSSWLILKLPTSLLSYFYLIDLRQNNLTLLGAIAFIFSLLAIYLVLYRVLSLSYICIKGKYFELPRLTSEECSRLKHFISNKSVTQTFNTTDGVIDMLLRKGLIFKAQSNPVTEHYEQDFHIYRWIYSKLIKHPEVITDKIIENWGEK